LEHRLIRIKLRRRPLRRTAHRPGDDRLAAKRAHQRRRRVREIVDVPGEEVGRGAADVQERRPIALLRRREGGEIGIVVIGLGDDAERARAGAGAQEGHHLGVEALEGERTVIGRGDFRGAGGQSRVAVETTLDLADQPDPPGDQLDEFAQRRDRLVRSGKPQCAKRGEREIADAAFRAGQPCQRVVVEDDGLAVGRALDIAFDGVAGGARRFGGGERVLGPAGAVPTAMGDRPRRQPVEAQGTISNRPSTSQMALSGRWATPTVVRAWRPLSPKISAMRSEAPFIASGSASCPPSTPKKPPRRTTRAILSRSPTSACTWASTLIAESRAAALAASSVAPGFSLPTWAAPSLPSRPSGSCPETKTSAPVRTAPT